MHGDFHLPEAKAAEPRKAAFLGPRGPAESHPMPPLNPITALQLLQLLFPKKQHGTHRYCTHWQCNQSPTPVPPPSPGSLPSPLNVRGLHRCHGALHAGLGWPGPGRTPFACSMAPVLMKRRGECCFWGWFSFVICRAGFCTQRSHRCPRGGCRLHAIAQSIRHPFHSAHPCSWPSWSRVQVGGA